MKRRDRLEGRGMGARKRADGMINPVKPMLQGISDGHTIQVINIIKTQSIVLLKSEINVQPYFEPNLI